MQGSPPSPLAVDTQGTCSLPRTGPYFFASPELSSTAYEATAKAIATFAVLARAPPDVIGRATFSLTKVVRSSFTRVSLVARHLIAWHPDPAS